MPINAKPIFAFISAFGISNAPGTAINNAFLHVLHFNEVFPNAHLYANGHLFLQLALAFQKHGDRRCES